jgi:hypothetical protein
MSSPFGTSVNFYQANIIYSDVSGGYFNEVSGNNYYNDTSGNGIGYFNNSGGVGYYMIIDKYETASNINYNSILENENVRELFFPVQNHYTKQIFLGPITDEYGFPIDQQTYLNQITLEDVDNASWVLDESFILQYIGITISALSYTGINSVRDLLKYDSYSSLESKALYVKRQDAIRVKNVLGNNIFRVTNSGNVQTQRIVTSNVSLYYTLQGTTPSIDSNIAGSADIMTIFAQNTLM